MRGLREFKKVIALFVAMVLILSTNQYKPLAVQRVSVSETKSVKDTLYKGPSTITMPEVESYKAKSKTKLDSRLEQLLGRDDANAGATKESLMKTLKQHKQFLSEGSYNESIESTAPKDMVYVYIKTNSAQGIHKLEPYVFKTVSKDDENFLVAAWVEVDKLLQLEALDEVVKVEVITLPKVNVDSEGDRFHRADLVRQLGTGTDGSGIKVGVISDGVNHLSDSIARGALPSNVFVLQDTQGGDEGTAMLEIVHALAPGATLYFSDCGSNMIEFNQAVDNLVSNGCDIIVDDIGWITEPFFQDGIVASHIKQVINDTGVVYVSSAGNAARSHFYGSYYNDGNNYNDFSRGTSSYKYMYVHIAPYDTVDLVLQWNDYNGSSSNDYDMFLINNANNAQLAYSKRPQMGSGYDPIEFIEYTNNTGSTIDAVIKVQNPGGRATTKNLNLYIYGNNYSNNVVPANSIFGQPAVPEVIAAGAINTATPTQIASYSSQGPVTMVDGSTRPKPDVIGADGVSVTGAGGFPNPFYGTSAAAPHIAAIAALLLAQDPSMSSKQVKDLITTSAVDMGVNGFDYIYGNGKADAYSAFSKIGPKFRNKTTYKGFKVNVDGTGACTGISPSSAYNWSFISKPATSQAVLTSSSLTSSSFTPDVLGVYKVLLKVTDTLGNSKDFVFNIKAKDMSSTVDETDGANIDGSENKIIGNYIIDQPIPLTDGWVIAPGEMNKIRIINVITGEIGKEYNLSNTPATLDFDFTNKIILASFKDNNGLVKIDVNTDEIKYINTSNKYVDIVNGENGCAFGIRVEGSERFVDVIDYEKGSLVSSLSTGYSNLGKIVYEKNNNNLIAVEIGVSPSNIYSFSFNETSKQLNLVKKVDGGQYGADLAISSDGKHIAFTCRLGNGNGYTVYDIDATDVAKHFGEWNTGEISVTADFTSDNKYIVISNRTSFQIYNVASHQLINTIHRNSIMFESYDNVKLSRGGRIIYDFAYIGSMDDYHMLNLYQSGLYPPISVEGDFDNSGNVDIVDLAIAAKKYNIKSSDSTNWDGNIDLDYNGIIDVYDLVLISKKIS